MIFKAPAKINLGLHVKYKREDGFHEIESVFHSIPLFDYIELIAHTKDEFFSYNFSIPGNSNDNLCLKALRLLRTKGNEIPNYQIHLLKNIPIGAGLGGGSSDAVSILKAVNQIENLGMTQKQLLSYAAELGSDCPFFVLNSPALVTGRGENIKLIDLKLGGYYLHLVNPGIHITTAEAYSSLDLSATSQDNLIFPENESEWTTCLKNDFEECLWDKHPELNHIKTDLMASGAFYSSLSGSGSSVFGLFKRKPKRDLYQGKYKEWILEL